MVGTGEVLARRWTCREFSFTSPMGRGRIALAIRVRGYGLTIDRNPSPQPSPNGRGSAVPMPQFFWLMETPDGPRTCTPQRIRLQLLAGLCRCAVDAGALDRIPAVGVPGGA